jgi:hypothetical protein
VQPDRATSAIELTHAIQMAAAAALVGCAPAHLGARTNATLVTAANAAAASFAVVLMACYNTETAGRPAALMPPLPYTSTSSQLAAQLTPPPPGTLPARTLSAPGSAWSGVVAGAPAVGSVNDGSSMFLGPSWREPTL